jgi:hypothetical protein
VLATHSVLLAIFLQDPPFPALRKHFQGLALRSAVEKSYDISMGHYTWVVVACNDLSLQKTKSCRNRVANDGIDLELALDLMAGQLDNAVVKGDDKANHLAAAQCGHKALARSDVLHSLMCADESIHRHTCASFHRHTVCRTSQRKQNLTF